MKSIKHNSFIIVLSSPSGGGKTTVANELVRRDEQIIYSISATTRPKRTGEVDKVDYFFYAEDTFCKMEENNEFVETATVHGSRYGTPKSFLDKELEDGYDVVLDVDIQGARSLRKEYPDGLYIFIAAPSLAELEQRLRSRNTDSDEVIERRLQVAEKEMSHIREYDYLVINEELEETIEKISAIILAERQKISRQKEDMINGFCSRQKGV